MKECMNWHTKLPIDCVEIIGVESKPAHVAVELIKVGWHPEYHYLIQKCKKCQV